jgi:Zn finger protein HypA/HybF involved in hydrogenase expression
MIEYLGVGMMFSPENVFYGYNDNPIIYAEIGDAKIEDEVKRLLAEGASPGDDYSRDIYYCQNCKFIKTNFYFSLAHNEKVYTPDYKCRYCDNSLERIVFDSFITIKELDIICKKCGGNDYAIEDEGCWD